MKEDLLKEVTKEELNSVINSFQKGKILGPDGFTLEFFQGFYDMLKRDLLEAVKESRRAVKILGAMNATFIALIPNK